MAATEIEKDIYYYNSYFDYNSFDYNYLCYP